MAVATAAGDSTDARTKLSLAGLSPAGKRTERGDILGERSGALARLGMGATSTSAVRLDREPLKWD